MMATAATPPRVSMAVRAAQATAWRRYLRETRDLRNLAYEEQEAAAWATLQTALRRIGR